ncbi:ORC1-type DNA replication protein [Methanofollis formosanus]|uniref:ORC1-type DNA replication protein n=1 Tax=Methanofollis formosanus TaxID=299308 RepID=A0A8G1EGT7_9EURY|nr:ORC1-type DNA replication protein [Methanofollis formosanus]QYZ80145.1 ORC1-type DNA replication protein [Methanofollis formosanus]
MKPLTADQTLFRDPAVFESAHLPEVFNHRDTQLEALAFALRPAFAGYRPQHAVLRGVPGTGKTTAIRLLFAEVEETTTQVVPVLVSCQVEKSLFAVVAEIFRVLVGHAPPTSGVSIKRLMSEVAHVLMAREAAVVVCLDDAHWLLADGGLDAVLAPLLRMHEVWPAVRVGVVLTLSAPEADLARALDPGTRSVFQAAEVFFPPYSAGEVRAILGDRVRAGLYPGVMPPAVLDLVVERAVATADLRVGLDLIGRAARAAEEAGRRTVTAGDVLAAFVVSKNRHLAVTIEGLSASERAVLAAALDEGRAEDGAAGAGQVYGRVCEGAEMSYTVFHERLKKLERLRLVDVQMVRRGRGRRREIGVREGVEEVLCRTTGRHAGVAEDQK